MSQKFTILFDLDGTLIDTAPDIMHAHNHVMKKYGYNERKLTDIKKLAGRGSKFLLTRSIHDLVELTGKIKKTEGIIEEMTKEFINFYSKNIIKESTLKNGALNFLSWCKNNSISMAVCTNKQEHLSIDLLKKIKIYDFFDYVAGQHF
jgi:phosphoglycolate phosphatase